MVAPVNPGVNIIAPTGQLDQGPICFLKAGVPTDADFGNPINGIMVYDTVDLLMYIRTGGVWQVAFGAVLSNDLVAQTATVTVLTFAVPAAAVDYEVGAYLNITAIVGSTMSVGVNFYDENGVLQGITLIGNQTTTGFSASTTITIRAKAGIQPLTIICSKVGGTSVTYDIGGWIRRLV